MRIGTEVRTGCPDGCYIAALPTWAKPYPKVRMREPRFLQLHQIDAAHLAQEATAGLLAAVAHASPKFFYDALGSRLFDAITELDEYYPTRTEAAIFATHGVAIAQAVAAAAGAAPTLVDLGAGNCEKAQRLFATLQPARYVAVDISVDFLRHALTCLQRQHPAMDLVGVGLDFSARLALPAGLVQGPAVVFYPGSSIGNFSQADALRLLQQAREVSGGGALLIGVDLIKDHGRLQRAYDDPLGVTAAFNLNLLRHLNRLLGADFQLRQWQHVALVRPAAAGEQARIEMHLQAREAVEVNWRAGLRRFAAGERIHTENSYKWQVADFQALLRQAGFAQVQAWTDAQGDFAVMLAH